MFISKGWWRWLWQLDYQSYKSCKAPVKSSPPTNQHPVFLQAGCPSCRSTNSVKALKGKYHISWTCLPQAHLGVFQLCLWPLIAPGYLGGGSSCLSSALWCQYPILSTDSLSVKESVDSITCCWNTMLQTNKSRYIILANLYTSISSTSADWVHLKK